MEEIKNISQSVASLTKGIELQMERLNLRNLSLQRRPTYGEDGIALAGNANDDGIGMVVCISELMIDGFDLVLGLDAIKYDGSGENKNFLGFFAPQKLVHADEGNNFFWCKETSEAVADTMKSALEWLCDM